MIMKNNTANSTPASSEYDFQKTATKVTTVSIVGNTILSAFKLLAGIIANSGAMVSDAIHSASDVFSSIIVIIGVKLSARESDKEHPYGHERFECVAAIILSAVLLETGLMIGTKAARSIFNGDYNSLAVPGISSRIALIGRPVNRLISPGCGVTIMFRHSFGRYSG